MNFWIFKISTQDQYPDQHEQEYAFDKKHSTQVNAGDCFVYLDKRNARYGFIGHGEVTNLLSKAAGRPTTANPDLQTDYVAQLGNCVQYSRPLSIKGSTKEGKINRATLGLVNLNDIGWSRSIILLRAPMFERIVELAYGRQCVRIESPNFGEYEVPDSWSSVRRRDNLAGFKRDVLVRQNYTCAICGTTLREVLDVAHVSSYAADPKNRANPANGIALCAYCHRAFDNGVIQIHETGMVTLAAGTKSDPVLDVHISTLTPTQRLELLEGVDHNLLRQRASTVS